MNIEIKKLRKKFESRWLNIVERSIAHNVPLPDKDALWNKLLSSFLNGFRCTYCNRLLLIKDVPPYLRVFSIDHKISLDDGGDNSIENLEIVCHRCNIVKGTIHHDTFKQMIGALSPTLLDRMFKEIWSGRLADKLDREDRLK